MKPEPSAGPHCRECRGQAQVQVWMQVRTSHKRGVFLLGSWLQGVRCPMAGAVASTAPACEEHLQGLIPDSLASEALARGRCIHGGCCAQGWGGTVLLEVVVPTLCWL